MRKATLKEIKSANAADITRYSFEDCRALKNNCYLEVVAISSGVYGINGALLADKNTNELYKITSRNSVLFQMV